MQKIPEKLKIIIVLVFVLLLGVFILYCCNSGGSSGNGASGQTDIYGHDKYDAIAVAEKTVKNNLVSPSSAKFCKMSEYSVTLHGETWTVTGHVDANNSLGASIRNTFLVMFTFTSSDRYNIDLCSID